MNESSPGFERLAVFFNLFGSSGEEGSDISSAGLFVAGFSGLGCIFQWKNNVKKLWLIHHFFQLFFR
jgi:hypothetical protein